MRGSLTSMYSWSSKVLALTPKTLSVYRDDGSAPGKAIEEKLSKLQPEVVFHLAEVSEVKESTKRANAWKVTSKDSKAWFAAESPEQCEAWLSDLQLYIDVIGDQKELPERLVDNEEAKEEEKPTWFQSYFDEYFRDFLGHVCEYLEQHDDYFNVETPSTADDSIEDLQKQSEGPSSAANVGAQGNLLLRFAVALQGAMMSYTGMFCYALLVLNHAINGGVATMILPIVSFLWAIPCKPRPPQWWWHIIILYTLFVVSLQYVIKLPAFCKLEYMYGIKGHCSGLSDASTIYLTTPYVLGIRSGSSFLSIAWADIAVLVAVGVHIKRLQYTGRWDDGKAKVENSVAQFNESVGFMTEVHVELPAGVTEEEYHEAERGLISSDYYAFMFFSDTLALLFTVLFYSNMADAGETLQESLDSNNLDWTFVTALIAQFLVLIIDRVSYLTKANRFKWYLQLLQVLTYHVILLLVFQMQSGFLTLRVYYMLKCAYLGFSAVQIRDSYPMYTQGEYLTRTSGEEPSLVQYYCYNIYRACPFLFELRVLLDWACCRTALDFYQWFKLEDIHGQLFMTKCLIYQRRIYHTFDGEEQPLSSKLLVGVGTFIILCLLLWLPLILFSNQSVLLVANPVTAASLHVSLSDGFRNYRLYSVDSGLTRNLEVQDLQVMDRQKIIEPYFDKTGTQIIRFPKTSDTVFTVPPPLVNDMIMRLTNPNRTVSFHVQTVWERKLPVDNREVSFSSVTPLSLQKKQELANVINAVLSSDKSIEASFAVNHLVPDVVHLSARKPVNQLGKHMHNIMFTFNHMQDGHSWEQWWDVQFVKPKQAPGPVEMFAVSSEVLGSYMGIGSYISQLGIVGFYVSVVFVVGRLLRGFVANLQTRVMYEDMEDVSAPMALCKNIYLARQEAGTALDQTSDDSVSSALKLEDRLYWELIRLYRQPEKLYRYTTVQPHSPSALSDLPADSGES